MNLLPVDFQKERTFGVLLDCIAEVSATGVARDDGFTATWAGPPNLTTVDVFGGAWHFAHTAVANQLLVVATTNEVFQFVQNLPIRFQARLHPGPTTPEELNIFLGCMNAIGTAPCVDAGAGPKATGEHFGCYTPEAGGAVYAAADDDMWMAVSMHNDVRQETILNAANSIDGQDHRVYVAGPGAGIEHDFIAEWVPTNPVPGVGAVAPTIFDAECRFWIDGHLVAKHTMAGVNQITIVNTQLMNFGLATLNTAAASLLDLKQLKCDQLQRPRV